MSGFLQHVSVETVLRWTSLSGVEVAGWIQVRRLEHSQRVIILVKHTVLYLEHSQRVIVSQCLQGPVFIL